MFEEFKVVDLVEKTTKDKITYYLVIYSSLEYCVRAYMNRETYMLLLPHKNELYNNFDMNKIRKVYNSKEKNFSYFVSLETE